METEQLDSHLFTIRVWIETAENNQIQYRGKLQHVPSGEVRHYRGLEPLSGLMLEILQLYTDTQFGLTNQDQPADPII